MADAQNCRHENMRFDIRVAFLEDVNMRYAEIRGACEACGAPVKWRGKFGLNPDQARVSVDRLELSAPLMMGDETLTGAPIGYDIDMPASGRN